MLSSEIARALKHQCGKVIKVKERNRLLFIESLDRPDEVTIWLALLDD